MLTHLRRTLGISLLTLTMPVMAGAREAHATDGFVRVPSHSEYMSRLMSPMSPQARWKADRSPHAAPSGALIHCNKFYSFSDSNGTYTIQHACFSATAPWSFKISPSVCAIVTSEVAETGMSWTRNGVTQSRQAPHVEACTYLFHGTYNPAKGLDKITYSDIFSFTVTGGRGSLTIRGSFTILDSTCSPTSC